MTNFIKEMGKLGVKTTVITFSLLTGVSLYARLFPSEKEK